MGKKSREKRERRQPPRRNRTDQTKPKVPGITVRREGQAVVLDKKMSDEEHAAFVGTIERRVRGAPAELASMRDRLVEIIRSSPTAELLARLADILMQHDPETYKESEGRASAIEIEYPAWLALQMPAPRSDGGPMSYQAANEAAELLDSMFRLTQLRLMFERTMSKGVTKPSAEDEVIAFSRTQELGVRNPGFLGHLRSHLEALFTDQGDLERLVGFSIADLLAVMRAVHSEGDRRFGIAMGDATQTARPLIRELMRGKSDADIAGVIPLDLRRQMTKVQMRQAAALAIWHGERGKVHARAEELLTVTPSWVAEHAGVSETVARNILERFSLPFGQKSVADNLMSRYEPLEHRPLLRFPGDRYFPILMHLWNFGARGNLEEALAEDAAAWDRYERRRARFLEDRALALFARMLPGAQVERRLHYAMTGEGGAQQEFELDGLLAYGPVLFLIEGKGGRIRRAGLRGEVAKLRSDLKALMGVAHGQALRARRYLEGAERVTFRREDGSLLELSSRAYPEVYLVSVTLEPLDVFNMRLSLLREMGVLEAGDLPWSIQLADLEVVADHIEWGPQLVHYLRRRLALNRPDMAAAEELDYFSTYLIDGLALAAAADGGTPTYTVMPTTNTKEMDDYYMYTDGDRKTPAEKMRIRLPDATREMVEVAAQLDPTEALAEVTALLDRAPPQAGAGAPAAAPVP